MVIQEYIKKDVHRMTGLSPRLIQFYVDEGVVEPEIYRGTKRGDHHKFSKTNVFEFAIIKGLIDHGMKISTIKEIIHFFRDRFPVDKKRQKDLNIDFWEWLVRGDKYFVIRPALQKRGVKETRRGWYTSKDGKLMMSATISDKKSDNLFIWLPELREFTSVVVLHLGSLYAKVFSEDIA